MPILFSLLSSFSGHYLGFSLQVGWRQEVLLKLKDRTSLKFELFDYVLLETSEGVASMSRQLVNSFSLSSRNLLDVKRKSPVCVQFKLKPSTASSLHSQLGIHFQEDFGSKLICTFSEKILTAFLEELEISRFSRKIKYGFLGLRSKWVPY